jgi:hypothetical protein
VTLTLAEFPALRSTLVALDCLLSVPEGLVEFHTHAVIS